MSFEYPVEDHSPLELIRRLMRLMASASWHPEEPIPLDPAARQFFETSWEEAQGLLAKTRKLRVVPASPETPHAFRFELDCRYKRRESRFDDVETVDGTLTGTIRYRPDLFSAPANEPCVVVLVDSDPALFHPNFNRDFGFVCLGGVESGSVLLLSDLLEHLYSILSYANFSTTDPADLMAARYFAEEPGAFDGLHEPEPLY